MWGLKTEDGFITQEVILGLFFQELYDCNRQKWEVAYFRLIKSSDRYGLEMHTTGTGDAAQVAECLPGMREALALTPSTP